MTNREYAKEQIFLNHCKKANVKPTTKQASKFRRGLGAVYKISVAGEKDIHVPAPAKDIPEN